MPPARGGSTERTPSPPMPRRRSQSRLARSALMSSSASTTTKSLPRPWYFQKESDTRGIVSGAEAGDGALQHAGARLELCDGDVLAGAVGDADVARAEDAALGPHRGELGELGAEWDRSRGVPGLALEEAHDLCVRRRHRRRVEPQRRARDADLVAARRGDARGSRVEEAQRPLRI